MRMGKNEQVSEYVVKSEACPLSEDERTNSGCSGSSLIFFACNGCMGNGERLVVSTAIPVERASVTRYSRGYKGEEFEVEPDSDGDLWVPVGPEGDQT